MPIALLALAASSAPVPPAAPTPTPVAAPPVPTAPADPACTGDAVVSVGTDLNFDGWNDLLSLQSNGQGNAAIDGYLVWLYDPAARRFTYSPAASALENLSVDPAAKQLVQEFCRRPAEDAPANVQGSSVCEEKRWAWEGGALVPRGERTYLG